MVGIIGIKKLNQKGYLLLESLLSFLILTICISLYLPLIAGLLVTVKEEKKAVERARVCYEQSQKISLGQSVDNSWQTGGVTYQIHSIEKKQKKGIQINDGEQQLVIEILSSKVENP